MFGRRMSVKHQRLPLGKLLLRSPPRSIVCLPALHRLGHREPAMLSQCFPGHAQHQSLRCRLCSCFWGVTGHLETWPHMSSCRGTRYDFSGTSSFGYSELSALLGPHCLKSQESLQALLWRTQNGLSERPWGLLLPCVTFLRRPSHSLHGLLNFWPTWVWHCPGHCVYRSACFSLWLSEMHVSGSQGMFQSSSALTITLTSPDLREVKICCEVCRWIDCERPDLAGLGSEHGSAG